MEPDAERRALVADVDGLQRTVRPPVDRGHRSPRGRAATRSPAAAGPRTTASWTRCSRATGDQSSHRTSPWMALRRLGSLSGAWHSCPPKRYRPVGEPVRPWCAAPGRARRWPARRRRSRRCTSCPSTRVAAQRGPDLGDRRLAPGASAIAYCSPDGGAASPVPRVGSMARVSRAVSSRWSPTRSAFAIAVSAGFTAPMLGKKLVSTTYRLSTSCALQSGSSTEVAGSLPNRTVPAWWAHPATGMSFFM